MSTEVFPELRVSGDATARGLAHGEQFRARIERTLEFYLTVFALPQARLRDQAESFAEIIGHFSAEYAAEIEGIALGAAVEPWLIYALNSRSEILNNCAVPECTSVINTRQSQLGQNWDWSQALEDLVILLRVEHEDGHRFATLTEPGILAKVGMNSAGLGVCLNILKTDTRLRGLPVHVLLRAMLDCRDMTQLRALVAANAPGKASHILAGDARGEYLSTEFAGESQYSLKTHNGLLWHSNHYLAADENTGEAFYSTEERYTRAETLINADSSADGLWQMLLDQSEGLKSICRPYSPSEAAGFGNVGTVFSLMMDLKRGSMRIRPGSDPGQGSYTIFV